MSADSVLAGEDRWTIVEDDCLEALAALPDASVDAVCTDPPYGLEFMGKEWDSFARKSWEAGGGFTPPGIGDRPTKWPSFSATARHGAANPTCAKCGGRARGKKKCACDEPEWKPIGKRRNPENEGLPDETSGGGMAAHMRNYQAWCETWARECLRVLKPGGHLLAFGGTRTYHRLACAVEDAGFEVRDSVTWIYGQGFPKSLDVGKAIDKAAGAEREVVGEGPTVRRIRPGADQHKDGHWEKLEDRTYTHRETAPATPEAAEWDGWGTALKPAHEPIVVARKPLGKGTVAANVLEHGTGALNIGASRIGTDGGTTRSEQSAYPKNPDGSEDRSESWARTGHQVEATGSGRWPANIMLGHTEFCVRVGIRKVKGITGTKAGSWRKGHQYSGGWKGAPEEELGEPVGYADAEGNEAIEDWRCVAACPVAQLDAQSGETTSRSSDTPQPVKTSKGIKGGAFGHADALRPGGHPVSDRVRGGYDDRGGASRFFYQAKASGGERWLWCADCKVAAPRTAEGGRDADCPLHGEDPPEPDFGPLFGGGDGTCSCPRTVRDAHRGHAVEMHPTQKPADLMLWLVRLVTPPGGVVLDPFVGSGTTVAAALHGGFRAIGVERHEPYAVIAKSRISAEFSNGRGGGAS